MASSFFCHPGSEVFVSNVQKDTIAASLGKKSVTASFHMCPAFASDLYASCRVTRQVDATGRPARVDESYSPEEPEKFAASKDVLGVLEEMGYTLDLTTNGTGTCFDSFRHVQTCRGSAADTFVWNIVGASVAGVTGISLLGYLGGYYSYRSSANFDIYRAT
jgi:hypothetical protein